MGKYSKRERKNSYEYQRILEILDDYWLSEPDEFSVDIDMHFVKGDGQEQFKHISWINDQIATEKKTDLKLISLADIVNRGTWEITDAFPHIVYCSKCFKSYAQTHWEIWKDGTLSRNFCPNCGARMVSDGDVV